MKNKKPNRFEQAQSLVEFAFGVMILLILLVGIVDVSRALFTYMALRDAAQEGALYGSTDPTNVTVIENRVRQASDMLMDMDADITVSVAYTGSVCTGNGITVQVTYPNFPLTMPFLGALVGGQTIPITASVTDTILRPPCSSFTHPGSVL